MPEKTGRNSKERWSRRGILSNLFEKNRKLNDIEKYLAGEMTAEEQAAFDAEMERNPALAKEVAFLRQLTENIETAVLDERVKQALKDLPPDAPANSKYQWWLVLVLAAILVMALLFSQKDEPQPRRVAPPPAAAPTPDSLQQAPPRANPDLPSSQETETEKTTSQPERPIAQNQPNENTFSPVPAPRLRGQGASTDTARQALLDAAWFTEYPPQGLEVGEAYLQVDELLRQGDFSKSYARLQLLERKMPANDTLLFLKGYCLLQRGEGGEALRYFDKMENEKPFGKDLLEWYRGLAFLLSGEDGKAKKIFRDISAKPAHAFNRQARQALKMTE